MKRRCVIDEAIGETRAAIWEGRTLVELYTRRWTEENKPRLGDIYAGRVRKIERSLGAAFIDLGCELDGFLKFTTASHAPRLSEGLRIEVEITREAEEKKGPMVKFLKLSPDSTSGRLSGQDIKSFITERFPGTSFSTAKVNNLLEAVEAELFIPGGGTLTIERTKALSAIDIDSGAAKSPFEVAKAACPVIASQLRLRGIGGLIVVDFPNLRQKRQREELMKAFSAAFEADPNIIKIAPLSRFGVIEMTRSRIGRSLDDVLLDNRGDYTPETQALEALRILEREGRASPGAQLSMSVEPNVYEWLRSDPIDWETPLTERLGARYKIVSGSKFSVSADR